MKVIEALRREKGLKQIDLAKLSNLSQTDLSKIESGRLIPYKSQLIKIAKALNYNNEKIEDLLLDMDLNLMAFKPTKV